MCLCWWKQSGLLCLLDVCLEKNETVLPFIAGQRIQDKYFKHFLDFVFCKCLPGTQKQVQAHQDKLSKCVRVFDFGAGVSSQQSEPGKWENALSGKMGKLF